MRKPPALVAFFVILAAGPAVAAEAQSFDLVCKGQTMDAAGTSTPLASRYTIDLAAKRWCDRGAGCPYAFPILARHGDELRLLAVKTPYNEAAFDMNLKTGAFSRTTRIPDRPDSLAAAKGTCKPDAFTPFG